jgi:hypothetical protein
MDWNLLTNDLLFDEPDLHGFTYEDRFGGLAPEEVEVE